jgi:hypothetical protein
MVFTYQGVEKRIFSLLDQNNYLEWNAPFLILQWINRADIGKPLSLLADLSIFCFNFSAQPNFSQDKYKLLRPFLSIYPAISALHFLISLLHPTRHSAGAVEPAGNAARAADRVLSDRVRLFWV